MFIATIKKTIREHGMLQPAEKILVAVSGGPDSVALLHILHRLSSHYQISLVVAHLNHQLRGAPAAEDALFVEKLSSSLGLEFVPSSIDVRQYAQENKKNLEQAARILRLKFFQEAAHEKKACKIALGHTQNDQAETVLMRLFRGSGMEGISAIRPVVSLSSDLNVIRPLIDVSRDCVIQFLAENKLTYRVDVSNSNLDFMRNRVRAELLPYLIKHFNPNIVQVLSRNAAIVRADNLALSEIAEKAGQSLLSMDGHTVALDVEKLFEYPIAIRRRIIRDAIRRVKGDLLRVSSSHITSILQLAQPNSSGKSTRLPFEMIVQREFSRLIFARENLNAGCSFTYTLPLPGSVKIEELGYLVEVKIVSETQPPPPSDDKNHAIIDARVLGDRLLVRNRRAGDRYRVGAHSHKTVKKLMIENKIPRHMRDKVPLVLSGSEIIWIVGVPVAPHYKPERGAPQYGLITLKDLNSVAKDG